MLTAKPAPFRRARLAAMAAICTAMLALAGHVQAHDFWIEPATFHPRPGAIVAVHLRVGQNFIGDPVPRLSRSIEQFFIRQGDRDEDIEGSDNIDPAGFLRADGRTTAAIGYRSSGTSVELPAGKFEDYLYRYGLDAVVAERVRRGESGKPGREWFFRYAKALLTGVAESAAVTQPLGFAYEIVPDGDPTARDGPLRGHVLYDGKPLAGALVVALWRDAPSIRLTQRSDAQGRFAFDLPRAGIWLVTSVHMVRAALFSDADWYSLWASLTFERPAQPP